MKKTSIFALLLSCMATAGISQTVDVSTLSDYEKQVHRATWCITFNSHRYDNYTKGIQTFEGVDFLFEGPRYEKYHSIRTFYDLLSDNDFFDKDSYDGRRVRWKLDNDMEKQLIFGEISFSLSDIDECYDDLKAMLKEEYIHNFLYMEK